MDKLGGVGCGRTIVLTGVYSATNYLQPLRGIDYLDILIGKAVNPQNNYFGFAAPTVAELYRFRSQVELFESTTGASGPSSAPPRMPDNGRSGLPSPYMSSCRLS